MPTAECHEPPQRGRPGTPFKV